MNDEHLLPYRHLVTQIDLMLRTSPQDWNSYIGQVGQLLDNVDRAALMTADDRIAEEANFIGILQKMASQEPSNRNLSIIASWCVENWSLILNHDEYRVDILTGRSLLVEQPHQLDFAV